MTEQEFNTLKPGDTIRWIDNMRLIRVIEGFFPEGATAETCTDVLFPKQSEHGIPIKLNKHFVTDSYELDMSSPHTFQRLAADALQVLNACNPSGVFRSAHEAASILSAHCNGTAEVSAHPILKMYMSQLMQLTGCGLMDPEVFHVAYEAVKELAMKETQP